MGWVGTLRCNLLDFLQGTCLGPGCHQDFKAADNYDVIDDMNMMGWGWWVHFLLIKLSTSSQALSQLQSTWVGLVGPGPWEVVPGFVGFVGPSVGLGVGGVVSPGEQIIMMDCVQVHLQPPHTSWESWANLSDPDVGKLDACTWEVCLHVRRHSWVSEHNSNLIGYKTKWKTKWAADQVIN